MKLTQLIDKLILYDGENDSIYVVESLIKEIKNIEPKDNRYIDNILEVLEKRKIKTFASFMLTCALRDLPMSQIQIKRVWDMVKDTANYREIDREYLMKVLATISLEKSSYVTDALYRAYKNETLIEKKIKITEVLINVKNFSNEVASWLFNFAINDNLPSSIDDINTLALKTDCCEILSTNNQHLKSARKAIFHLLISYDFCICKDEYQWSIIEQSLLKIPLEKEDIYYILKLIKDKSLISYHRIQILSLLTKLPLTIDIVGDLIEILIMEDEAFEDFNKEVLKTILKLEITPKQIEKIEKLKTSNEISKRARMQLEQIKSV